MAALADAHHPTNPVNLTRLNNLTGSFMLLQRMPDTHGLPSCRRWAYWGLFAALIGGEAATVRTVASPVAVVAPAGPGTPARVSADDPNLCFMGRWEVTPHAATTVNSGACLRFRYSGRQLTALFDVSTLTAYPQIYVTIDNGERRLCVVDRNIIDLVPGSLAEGIHLVEIEVKDVSESVNRWVPPFQSALIFLGFELDANGSAEVPGPALVGRWAPSAARIEFYGDSITQGVRALGMAIGPDGSDGTQTYAYLAGVALNANTTQVGFGSQGIIRSGGGRVPAAIDSFGLNFTGSPSDPRTPPDAVVINLGTNDGRAVPAVFAAAYRLYLERIAAAYPLATIFALRPFNGTQAESIRAVIATLAHPRIRYVDTTGWLGGDPGDYTEQPRGLHPSVAGHRKAAQRLVRELRAAGFDVGRTAGSR